MDRQAETSGGARLQVVSLFASATMWRRMGNAAGMVRNRWIRTASDAAWRSLGRGERDAGMIEICQRAGKPVLVIRRKRTWRGWGLGWQACIGRRRWERWTF